ncbi:MAG: TIR domain-containing protein [Chloroflexota bacterium]|nr:TIR domain-containing protein [Chloroflexota bacterium]
MAYRNKTFVSFDGDNDMHYYRLMCAWKRNDNIPFNFFDAHDLNTARDSSQEVSIKRQLRTRLLNAKIVVSLIGEHTRYLYKFVRWELEQSLDLGLPIVAVNLNGRRSVDQNRCPPIIRERLVIHINFGSRILQHALDNWPARFARLREQGIDGPRYYVDDVYTRLAL